jgi:hypothetical protein
VYLCAVAHRDTPPYSSIAALLSGNERFFGSALCVLTRSHEGHPVPAGWPSVFQIVTVPQAEAPRRLRWLLDRRRGSIGRALVERTS